MFLAKFPSLHTLGFPFLQSSGSKNVLKLIKFPYPMRNFADREKGLLKSLRNDDLFFQAPFSNRSFPGSFKDEWSFYCSSRGLSDKLLQLR